MIEWHKDNDLAIYFSIIPIAKTKIITPFLSKEEINECKRKPFINCEEFNVLLKNYIKEKEYYFTITKNYAWDGASIPRFFWRLIGSKTEPEFLIPSLIHDTLCENHHYIENDRYFSTMVFDKLLYVSKVNPLSRWAIKHSVDNFQKFKGWNNEL